MSSHSIYDGGDEYHCGITKMVSGDHIMSSAIHHYYPGRHPTWSHKLWAVDENVRAGYFAWEEPHQKSDYYEGTPCFDEIIKAAVEEQSLN